MTLRGAAWQGGLALVALMAAYRVSQKPEVQLTGDVKVLELSKSELERVRYENGTAWVELLRADEGGEESAWLRISARTLPPARPVPDGGVAPPPVTVPERDLRGNKSAVELLNRFTPLYATRSLGVLPPAKLKELGLDLSRKRLTVVGAGKSYAFTVSTSAGPSAPYLRRDPEGEVFILGGSIISDLDSLVEGPSPGGRLLERQLHSFKVEPDDSLALTFHERNRELVALPGDVAQTIRLAYKTQPTTPDAFAKNWHDKLWRLPPQELLGKGELPTGGAPKVELRVVYRRGRRELGYLELGRLGREVFARTEHSAGWVKLPPTAEEVLLESEKVVPAPAGPEAH